MAVNGFFVKIYGSVSYSDNSKGSFESVATWKPSQGLSVTSSPESRENFARLWSEDSSRMQGVFCELNDITVVGVDSASSKTSTNFTMNIDGRVSSDDNTSQDFATRYINGSVDTYAPGTNEAWTTLVTDTTTRLLVQQMFEELADVVLITPDTVNNLVAWYDMSNLDSMTLDGLDRCSALADLSGTGMDVTQDDPLRRPRYVENAVNGRSALLFNGTDDGVNGSLLSKIDPISDVAGPAPGVGPFYEAPFTILAAYVYEPVDNVNATGVIWFLGDRTFQYIYWSTFVGATGIMLQRSASTAFRNANSPDLVAVGVPQVVSGVELSDSRKVRLDIGPEGVDNNVRFPARDHEWWSIGGRRDATANNTQDPDPLWHWPGYLCEIMIYDRELDEVERVALETYLATKWGATLNGGFCF